jgi:hypothetical protein
MCPGCADQGIETWVIAGRVCGRCGTACDDADMYIGNSHFDSGFDRPFQTCHVSSPTSSPQHSRKTIERWKLIAKSIGHICEMSTMRQ